MMDREADRLLTVFEAEDMTGRKAATWRKDILRRRIPYVKIGRQVRIPLEAVRAVIAKGYREPIASPTELQSAPPGPERPDRQVRTTREGRP